MAEDDEKLFLVRYMEDRFGIPASDFHDCAFFKHQQSWWMIKNTSGKPLPYKLKVSMVGLKAFHKVGAFVKPTTRLIQVLGSRATKSRLDLSRAHLNSLLSKGSVDFSPPPLEDGYVILRLGGYVLGLGLLVHGKLKSQLPRKDLAFYSFDRLASATGNFLP